MFEQVKCGEKLGNLFADVMDKMWMQRCAYATSVYTCICFYFKQTQCLEVRKSDFYLLKLQVRKSKSNRECLNMKVGPVDWTQSPKVTFTLDVLKYWP